MTSPWAGKSRKIQCYFAMSPLLQHIAARNCYEQRRSLLLFGVSLSRESIAAPIRRTLRPLLFSTAPARIEYSVANYNNSRTHHLFRCIFLYSKNTSCSNRCYGSLIVSEKTFESAGFCNIDAHVTITKYK